MTTLVILLAMLSVTLGIVQAYILWKPRKVLLKHMGVSESEIPWHFAELSEKQKVLLQSKIWACLAELGKKVSIAALNEIEADLEGAREYRSVADELKQAIRNFNNLRWAATYYNVHAPHVRMYLQVQSPHFPTLISLR